MLSNTVILVHARRLAHVVITKGVAEKAGLMDERELKKVLENRDVVAVEKALDNGDLRPCQRIGRDGFTLLHWSCYYGLTEVEWQFLNGDG